VKRDAVIAQATAERDAAMHGTLRRRGQSTEAGGFAFVRLQSAGPDGDVLAQTERALIKLQMALSDAGLALDRVVRCGVYLADAADAEAVGAVLQKFFPAAPPVWSIVRGAPVDGARVAVDAIAAR
jgi:enamine deaminase RidA (YjgF/YER057c/UK114 family)